jgi:hypothetical protein
VEFDFSEEKNELLFKEKGITFFQIIEAIAEKEKDLIEKKLLKMKG